MGWDIHLADMRHNPFSCAGLKACVNNFSYLNSLGIRVYTNLGQAQGTYKTFAERLNSKWDRKTAIY